MLPSVRSTLMKQQSESSLLTESFQEGEVPMKPHVKSCLKKSSPYASDDDISVTSCSTRSSKNVSFHKIEINLIPMELGDNPTCKGIPVTLGWEADRTEVFDLEAYEEFKPYPRTKMELQMSPAIRQEYIVASGDHARSEIAAVMKETEKIQKSRARSIKNQKWDGLNYAFQNVKRKVSHNRGRRSSIPGGMPPLCPNTGRVKRRSSMSMVQMPEPDTHNLSHSRDRWIGKSGDYSPTQPSSSGSLDGTEHNMSSYRRASRRASL